MGENRINQPGFSGPASWPYGISTPDFQSELPGSQPATLADLYAVAWTLARRDYEINRLFNSAYYYEI